MNIPNLFKLNDWEIKKFLIFVFSIQLSVWGLIGLDLIGINIPILRQLICFIYLTFIPGFTILRILKIHNLDNIENLLLTLGLSLLTIMILGLIINSVLPLIGINNPFSIEFLIISISLLVFIFCLLAYLRDSEYYIRSKSNLYPLFSPKTLVLLLIPFISIFGTYLVNNFQNYNLQFVLLVIIFIIIFLLGFFKLIPRTLYPLTIFSLSLSLLYDYSLISNFLTGWDINIEYHLSHLVIENGIWDPTIPSNVNSMLSITTLAPTYSIVLNLSLIWVFKIIYPFIFAFVPLALYLIFKKLTNENIALFACIFFISLSTFYIEMTWLARQQIAELFLVLFLLTILNNKIHRDIQFIFLVLFSFGLITSHYGLTYIFILMLVVSYLIIIINKIRFVKNIKEWISNRFKIMEKPIDKVNFYEYSPLKLNFILIFVILTFTWYLNVGQSFSFQTIAKIAERIISTFSTDFMNPVATQGLGIIQRKYSLLTNFYKYIHLTAQFFIGIGIVSLLLKPKFLKIRQEFRYFSIVALLIDVMGIVVPYFSSALNTSRLYQISLIFLAPFFIIGFLTITSALLKLKNIQWTKKHYKKTVALISIFLIIFLMFNSGWIQTILGENTSSIALGNIDSPIFKEQEIVGAKFFKNHNNNNKPIYEDILRMEIFLNIGENNTTSLPFNISKLKRPFILFLGEYNLLNYELALSKIKNQREYLSLNEYRINKISIIDDNINSKIVIVY